MKFPFSFSGFKINTDRTNDDSLLNMSKRGYFPITSSELQSAITNSVNSTPRCDALQTHGPLARYVKLRVVHAPVMTGTFSPPPRVNNSDMHHGTWVTHVPWCMSGSLTCGFLWSRWRGTRSRHSGACSTHNFTYLVRGPRSPVKSLACYWCSVAIMTILEDIRTACEPKYIKTIYVLKWSLFVIISQYMSNTSQVIQV